MNPQSVTIDVRVQRCHLQLHLPIFFDNSDLRDIRKVFKLMTVEPERNEETREKLRQFFPEWEQALKDQLDRAGAELTAAKRDAEDKRRTLAALGSTVDANIEQAKRWLTNAKRRAKKQPGEVEEYRAALNKATRPKTDYEQAVKSVKRLEAKIKQTKAAVERCGKVSNAYNKIIQG